MQISPDTLRILTGILLVSILFSIQRMKFSVYILNDNLNYLSYMEVERLYNAEETCAQTPFHLDLDILDSNLGKH